MTNRVEEMQQKQLITYAKDLAKIYKAEKNKRAQLEIVNKQLRATIDNISEGLITLDENKNIIEANLAFSKIAGLPLEEIIGEPLKKCLTGDGWAELHNNIDKVTTIEDMTINPDKRQEQFFKIILSPIFNKQNQQKGMVITIHDETKRERSNKLKEEFLGLISHEIRTPLAGITGFAELIEVKLSEYMSDEDHEFLQLLKDSSNRLIKTVGELVEASQLSMKIPSQREEFYLQNAVDEAISQAEYKLNKRNINIHMHDNESSCLLYGFRDQIVLAISHLLDNAIEFSHVGSEIDVRINESDEMWVVEIEDYGMGIPAAELDRVFDKFYQVEFYDTRSHEGLGLGLSIVRKIALLHHGKIILKSKSGEGTIAIFSLPKFDEKTDTEKLTDMGELKQQVLYLKQQTKKYAEELAATYSSKKDISSKLFKTQQQIIRADKLATMGQMAAGIAHEVNNKLTPLLGQVQILLMSEDQLDPKILNRLQIINDSGFKAANMLRQILNFSRKTSGVFEKIDIINLINKTVTLFNYRFRKSNVELNSQFAKERIEVLGNSGQLEQVFTNLIGNAIDAMEQGGQLTIDAAIKEETKNEQSVSWAEIKFTDTGSGMDKETQESIFEPFFTTKEEGKGTGLGLFITYQIIENHGGIIDVESKINTGTTFTIKLKSIK